MGDDDTRRYLSALTDPIIRQALADVRREAAQRTLAHHIRRVCDDAAEARRLVLLRRQWAGRGDPMSEYVHCRHGYMRRGWCFACEREERAMTWLERHDRHITVAIGLPTLLACLWVAGQGALHIL